MWRDKLDTVSTARGLMRRLICSYRAESLGRVRDMGLPAGPTFLNVTDVVNKRNASIGPTMRLDASERPGPSFAMERGGQHEW